MTHLVYQSVRGRRVTMNRVRASEAGHWARLTSGNLSLHKPAPITPCGAGLRSWVGPEPGVFGVRGRDACLDAKG